MRVIGAAARAPKPPFSTITSVAMIGLSSGAKAMYREWSRWRSSTFFSSYFSFCFIAIKQNEKYDEAKVAERHRDHSLFIAFAPLDNPIIAMLVIVENGGFGARAAAPIARTVLDYYLLGKMPAAMQAAEHEIEDDREGD